MYCKYCGKQQIEEFTGYFNTETGEKTYRYICPNKLCIPGHWLVPNLRL